MITLHPLWMMKDFISKYDLGSMTNVIVGKDVSYLMPAFYDIHNLPFYALYNKKGQLTRAGDGSPGIGKLMELVK